MIMTETTKLTEVSFDLPRQEKIRATQAYLASGNAGESTLVLAMFEIQTVFETI